jgi:hypothetical protein
MARLSFRNPGFMASPDLQPSQITPLNYCTSAKGVFDDTTPQQMQDAMAEYTKVSHDKTLALFFHGGLVDKASGMTNAQQLFAPYSLASDPSENAGNAYPYFFIWESGLLETLQHNLPEIVSETIFQRLRDIIGAKAQTVLGAPAQAPAQAMALRAPTLTANIPANAARALSPQDISDVEEAVESDPIINAEKRRIAQSARPAATALAEAAGTTPRQIVTSPSTLLSPEIVGAIVAEEAHKDAVTPQGATELISPLSFGTLALAAGSVLMRIVQRYATGRNHNFHNTVVEEIFRQYYIANVGWAIWNEMKVETAEAFQGDADHNVGTAMVAQLIHFYETGPDPKQARITLLGHSTGAVYICNFLAAVDQALASKEYASQIKFDVIFMAPAVRVDLFAATLAGHGHLIRNFRAFEMGDDLEAAEILLQLDGVSPAVNELLAQVYTSSLLYFISGVLEDPDDDTPIDGMQRFFTRNGAFVPAAFADIDAIWNFYGSRPNAVIASDTRALNPQPPLGQRCTSHHHGGFPSDNAAGTPGGTLQSVCYLLRTGLY